MTKNALLPQAQALKVARATNALLLLQWAHADTLSKRWNVTDPARCKNTHDLIYWLIVIVKDDEPRSIMELMRAAEAACKPPCRVCVSIQRRKDALRRLKRNSGDFATVYRLGYCTTTIKTPSPNPAMRAAASCRRRQGLYWTWCDANSAVVRYGLFLYWLK